MKKIDLKIILESDNEIPAFAGYGNHTGKEGAPKIVFNFMAMLMACAENGDTAIDYKMFFADSIVHEMLHMIQDIFDQAFDEKEIEHAILSAREYLKSERINGLPGPDPDLSDFPFVNKEQTNE